MPQERVTPAEVQQYVGKRVTLRLRPDAPAGPALTGRLVGTIDAADGLVLFLEPDERPGTRVSCHYHYVAEISPA
ncbi:MAG: hypothetical protein HYS09_00650 [Chloroflexi bacterium]|nr:hypothetical protein [Chloroflexota bacterium]